MVRDDDSPLVKRNSAIAGESGAEVDIVYGGGNSHRGSADGRDAGQTIADASSPPEDQGKKGGLGAGLLKIVLFSVTVLVYTLQPILNEQGMATKSVSLNDVTNRTAPMYRVTDADSTADPPVVGGWPVNQEAVPAKIPEYENAFKFTQKEDGDSKYNLCDDVKVWPSYLTVEDLGATEKAAFLKEHPKLLHGDWIAAENDNGVMQLLRVWDITEGKAGEGVDKIADASFVFNEMVMMADDHAFKWAEADKKGFPANKKAGGANTPARLQMQQIYKYDIMPTWMQVERDSYRRMLLGADKEGGGDWVSQFNKVQSDTKYSEKSEHWAPGANLLNIRVFGIPQLEKFGEKKKSNDKIKITGTDEEVSKKSLVYQKDYAFVVGQEPPMSIVNSYIYNTSWLYVCQVILEFLIAVVCICVVNSPGEVMLIFNAKQLWAILPVALVAALGYSMEPLAGLCGATIYAVLNQFKLGITAALMLAILQVNQSKLAWCIIAAASIAFMCLAIFITLLGTGEPQSKRDWAYGNFNNEAYHYLMPEGKAYATWLGLTFTIVKVFCSCLSTVLMEKVFKSGGDLSAPFFVQVAQFKFVVFPFMFVQWGLTPLLLLTRSSEFQDWKGSLTAVWPDITGTSLDPEHNVWAFEGFSNWVPWCLLLTLALKNYAVNAMLKVMSSLYKTFAEQVALTTIFMLSLIRGLYNFNTGDPNHWFCFVALIGGLVTIGCYTVNKTAEKHAAELAKRLPTTEEEKPLIGDKKK